MREELQVYVKDFGERKDDVALVAEVGKQIVGAVCGYARVSLSVQKENYAAEMYRKLGFVPVRENSEEYIVAREL